MTKSLYVAAFLFVSVTCGCNSSSGSGNGEEMYKGIPSTAYTIAENDSVIVFLNDEAIEDSVDGLPPLK